MIMTEELSIKIEEFAKPFLEEMGLEIVELNLRRFKGELTIQILADRTGGGITIEECTQLSRKISQVIDEGHLIPEGYFLEVSSPGIDRPLKTSKDFHRAIGRDIRVYLSQAFENKLEWEGLLTGIENGCLILGGRQGELRLPLAVVNKGVQNF